jgi:hypothetical protein
MLEDIVFLGNKFCTAPKVCVLLLKITDYSLFSGA